MSRKGYCRDNAVAESIFATIKGELVEHEEYTTRRSAIAAISDSIESSYSQRRRLSAIAHMTPIEFYVRFMSSQSQTTVT